MKRVLVISDNQLPFDHKDFLPFLKAVAKKYKINQVVHIGDLIDHHALAEYPHDPDGLSAGDELKQAKKRLKPYFRAFPKVKVCIGNHDLRIFSRALKNGIPVAYLRPYKDFLNAPKGWVWAERHEVDSVMYQHGSGYSGYSGALKAALDNHKSTVIGHLHSAAGVLYWANESKLLFGMNVGSGIDRKAYTFAYGKAFRAKPILSCGVVLEGRPQVVTMIVGKDHRWDGKV